jgi:hypothetical protein
MHHLRRALVGRSRPVSEIASWGKLGLLLLTACASAPVPPPKVATRPVEASAAPISVVHKRGGDKLIVEVGKAGGTLELDNGARLEIPQGALVDNVEVTFSRGTHTTAFSNHEWERPLGPTLEISPEFALGSPIKVSVPVSQLPEGFGEQDLALGLEVPSQNQRQQMQGTQTRWDYLPASTTSGRAVAELNSVPGYRLQFVVSKSE